MISHNDDTFEMWFNGNAGRVVYTKSDNELEAAKCMWPYDHRNEISSSLFIWVRRSGVSRAVCIEFNANTGNARFADHPSNGPDD